MRSGLHGIRNTDYIDKVPDEILSHLTVRNYQTPTNGIIRPPLLTDHLMKLYSPADSPPAHRHLLCGHWNGSPLEIGVSGLAKHIPHGEVYHYHEYHEYYIFLQGRGALVVNGREIPIEGGQVLMVEPREPHRFAWIDPEVGLQWVIVKEKSAADSKVIVEER